MKRFQRHIFLIQLFRVKKPNIIWNQNDLSFVILNPNKAEFRPPYEINVPILIQTYHTCHNPIFYGDHDENVFFPIQSHQRGLERRERQPGGV